MSWDPFLMKKLIKNEICGFVNSARMHCSWKTSQKLRLLFIYSTWTVAACWRKRRAKKKKGKRKKLKRSKMQRGSKLSHIVQSISKWRYYFILFFIYILFKDFYSKGWKRGRWTLDIFIRNIRRCQSSYKTLDMKI